MYFEEVFDIWIPSRKEIIPESIIVKIIRARFEGVIVVRRSFTVAATPDRDFPML